jgi:serine/threonine protein kinase
LVYTKLTTFIYRAAVHRGPQRAPVGRGKPLDLRRALSIAIQVTDALAAAHARGIIHRDIKARNVMVPDNVAALTALGHAQALAGKRAETEKTIARLQELSKQQYVSPYQVAVVYAGLDERERALDWIDQSHAERFNWLPFIS